MGYDHLGRISAYWRGSAWVWWNGLTVGIVDDDDLRKVEVGGCESRYVGGAEQVGPIYVGARGCRLVPMFQ